MAKIKAIIFDLDGVLINSIPAHFAAYELACQDFGIKINLEDYTKTTGLSWQKSIPIFTGIKNPDKIKEIHDKKNNYLKSCLNRAEPIDFMVDLLKFFRKKYLIAVATSASEESTNLLIDKLKIRKFLNVIITAKDVENAKPDPEIFLLSAKKIGIGPKNCLVIEDSDYGIEAARKAMMHYIKISFSK